MAGNFETSIFILSEETLQSLEQVGPVRARAIKDLLASLDSENKDVTVDELLAISPKTPWEKLIESGKLCLQRLDITSQGVLKLLDSHTVRILKAMDTLYDRIEKERRDRECIDKEKRERLEKEEQEEKRERLEKEKQEEKRERQRVDEEREEERKGREGHFRNELMQNINSRFDEFEARYNSEMQDMKGGFREAVKDMETRIGSLEINSPSAESSYLDKDLEPTRAPQDETVKVMKSISEKIDSSTKGGVYSAIDRPSRYSSYEKVRSTDSHLSYDRKYLDRDRSESPVKRKRSSSPAVPRMQMFSGSPEGLRFDTFSKRFCQIAKRRGWDNEKRLHRFIDCLSEQALEYALSSSDSDNFDMLVSSMKSRFDFREEPVIARQKLAILRQEAETEEQFLDKVQSLAHDGYPSEKNNLLLTRIIVETFLRGIKNKEAALYAAGQGPNNSKDALGLVKSFAANAKAFLLSNL